MTELQVGKVRLTHVDSRYFLFFSHCKDAIIFHFPLSVAQWLCTSKYCSVVCRQKRRHISVVGVNDRYWPALDYPAAIRAPLSVSTFETSPTTTRASPPSDSISLATACSLSSVLADNTTWSDCGVCSEKHPSEFLSIDAYCNPIGCRQPSRGLPDGLRGFVLLIASRR